MLLIPLVFIIISILLIVYIDMIPDEITAHYDNSKLLIDECEIEIESFVKTMGVCNKK